MTGPRAIELAKEINEPVFPPPSLLARPLRFEDGAR